MTTPIKNNNLLKLKKKLLSNKWYIIGITIFFILGYFLDENFFVEKFEKIKLEPGYTIGQIIEKSYAAQDCDMIYLYQVNGQYYRGKIPCLNHNKLCNKYLILYSKKEPHIAVLILDKPLNKEMKIGTELKNYKDQISDSLLMKWIKSESPYIDERYRKIEISKQFKTCK